MTSQTTSKVTSFRELTISSLILPLTPGNPGHRLKLRLNDDSNLIIKPKSTITFALQEGHGLRDVEGESIALEEPLKIDNWARYEQFGYDLDEWISLNPDESFVEGKKATLSFHSKADLTDDSTKAVIPEISDFQFWS